MKENDRTKFGQLLTAAAEMKRVELTEPAIELYWDALSDMSLDDFKRGLRTCLRTQTFLPQPNEIIAAVSGDTGSQALTAWSKLEKAIDRHWPYASVVFDDVIIHAVLQDMGGWISIGDREVKDWPFVQKEFERRYASYALRPPRKYPGKLLGSCERTNNSMGLESQAPSLIGDEDKAQLVLKGGYEHKELTAGQVDNLMQQARDFLKGEPESITDFEPDPLKAVKA